MIGLARRGVLGGVAASLAAPRLGLAAANLDVVCFPGAVSLPLVVARDRGYFKKQGVDVSLTFTPNSNMLREGLANGRYQVAHAAVDNAVAMQELAGVRIAVVSGGDNGFNHLFAKPDITSIAALRGRVVTVDAPNTAYALQLYKMLGLKGLDRASYAVRSIGATDFRLMSMLGHPDEAATMLSLGSAARAREAGYSDLGSAVGVLGPYQATAAFVLRESTALSSDVVARYLAGYIEGVRWVLDPGNEAAATGVLMEAYKFSASVAAAVMTTLVDPAEGLSKDAALDIEGFRNVLSLRAEIEGQWGGQAPSPAVYLDDGPYLAALRRL